MTPTHLDADVLKALAARASEEKVPLDELVNTLLRAQLAASDA